MDHVAIMKKSWGFVEKILHGQKTIESRWYHIPYPPWDKIHKGDIIYFKNSGEPVTVKAEVEKVSQYSDLHRRQVQVILNKHGSKLGLNKDEVQDFFKVFQHKKYCMLIFLKNAQSVKPFYVNKEGYGDMASWMTVENINEIKK